MLEKFRVAKQAEITALKKNGIPLPKTAPRPNFANALRSKSGIAAIGEYKRASPSAGVIRADLAVEDAASMYGQNGASAISILTEEKFFQGRLEYLAGAAAATEGKIPLLRKDFIFDPVQVHATAATPASALLLIARMLPDAAKLAGMRQLAESYGMDAVVEIFNDADLDLARKAGAKIIQVNARDLDTLKVSREACLELIARGRPEGGEIWIAASGMAKPEHLAAAKAAGFDAALIGGALMAQTNPGEALKMLLAGANL